MKQIAYVTGNDVKFRQAVLACESAGIELMQTKLDIIEIQSEQAQDIAYDKAIKAFEHLHQPILVSDDSWMIPGLKGFPGPYMKYVNDWFTIDDWLRLTRDLEDRRIVLRQIVVYQDASEQKLFSVDKDGLLLPDARGKSPYAHSSIVSFDNGQHANAEYHERNESAVQQEGSVWHKFTKWYQEYSA